LGGGSGLRLRLRSLREGRTKPRSCPYSHAMHPVDASVRRKVESAAIRAEPFPHLVIQDLLPEPFFRQLASSIPPVELFALSKDGIKSDLRLRERNAYFQAAPEEFKATWRRLRDEVFRTALAPALVLRLERELREKYADLFSRELADEIMAGGLESSDGRIMARRPGYHLQPHLDSAHFGVTLLLYFTAADNESTGALCLFRPERTPEMWDVSTYYPERIEGIAVELVEEIPIRENLFVAFLNRRDSLHGVRIDAADGQATIRMTYQAHIRPKRDLRLEAENFAECLADPAARKRWQRYVEARREAEKTKASPQ
jgi:hypothetical protein